MHDALRRYVDAVTLAASMPSADPEDAGPDLLPWLSASPLELPRLVSHQYRLYPVVDHIADKVCATMTEYNERSSSRQKDLVDLVVFATTQDIDGTALRVALVSEAHRRQMERFDGLAVPSAWGAGHAKLSKPVPHCAAYRTVDLAADLAKRLIDRALSGDADGKTWSHGALSWVR